MFPSNNLLKDFSFRTDQLLGAPRPLAGFGLKSGERYFLEWESTLLCMVRSILLVTSKSTQAGVFLERWVVVLRVRVQEKRTSCWRARVREKGEQQVETSWLLPLTADKSGWEQRLLYVCRISVDSRPLWSTGKQVVWSLASKLVPVLVRMWHFVAR